MQVFANNPMIQQRIDWLYDNWKGPIPIQQVFDPYNDNQQWYYIPGFNGYELSNYGNVRSMKNFNKYPFGTLCREKNGKYELSTNDNVRVNVTKSELIRLASTEETVRVIYGFPRPTCYRDIGSRNQRKFIDFEKVSKNKNAKKKPVPIRKEETYFPKFSVRPDREIKYPIYFEEQGDVLW